VRLVEVPEQAGVAVLRQGRHPTVAIVGLERLLLDPAHPVDLV
jgi:hypothetical protein